MSAAPAYRDTLRSLLEAMRAEVAALDAGDLSALEAGTAAKLAALSALQLSPLTARDPEIDAMIAEGAELNARAAMRVNLLLAQTERRLEALASAKGHVAPQRYGRNGRMAAPLRCVELKSA